MKFFEDSIDVAGQKLTLQFGKLAQASHVAVYASLGETVVLTTLNIADAPETIDYLPLQVEYVEKLYAGGRIKGSRWVKREGKASDDAALIGRLIDRGARPLFPKELRKSIQIVNTLLSIDGENSPEIVAAIATSAAIHVSSLPWNGPLSTMRVGYIKNNGESSYVVNPSETEQPLSVLDLMVTSTNEKVVMIETQAEQLPESVVIEGIKIAKEENNKIIAFLEKVREAVGHPKMEAPAGGVDKKIETILKSEFSKELEQINEQKAQKEFDNGGMLNGLIDDVMTKYPEFTEKKAIAKAIDYLLKQAMREKILTKQVRADGRKPDEIRKITVETSTLPRTHGSAVFQRGDTQVLSIVTLGSPSLEQLIESPEGEAAKHYIHHYYMPPYSVGEVGRMGFPSRREIGHGALAEKAIEPVLPDKKAFPYTIRVVSEVLSSNGSTSMASTCGSTLALMDAGVPIKAPVSGIAMGLIYKTDTEYVVLTDIMGIEDFGGDMDFKVTGSAEGVTAMQLDVKNDGLTDAMIVEILEKAKTARLSILEKMTASIDRPRGELSEFAPKVKVFAPPQEKIGEIIGPGGKNIRNLIAKFGVDINVDNSGVVSVSGIDKDKVESATSYIENMVREVQEGEEFDGEVKRMLPFGAFVEILPGKEGMVHVSKMGKGFVKDPSAVVNIGDKVRVRVYQIDQQGRVNLELLSGGSGTGESTMDFSEEQGSDRPPKRFDRGGGRGGSRGAMPAGRQGFGRSHGRGHGHSHGDRDQRGPSQGASRRPRIEIE